MKTKEQERLQDTLEALEKHGDGDNPNGGVTLTYLMKEVLFISRDYGSYQELSVKFGNWLQKQKEIGYIHQAGRVARYYRK